MIFLNHFSKAKAAVACLFIVLTFSPIISFCTCIVIKIYNNEIYVAADSKRTFANTGRPPQTICKIHQIGRYHYAIAGHGDSSLYAIVKEVFRNNMSITEVLTAFGEYVKGAYIQEMSLKKSRDPKTYSYYLFNPLAQVAFFYQENNMAHIYTIEFKMTDNGQTHVEYIILPEQPEALLGVADHIYPISRYAPSIEKYPNHFENFLRFLVETEINYHGDHIGGPIDLLKITPSGSEYWFTPQRKCPF